MKIGIDIRNLIHKNYSGIPEYTRNLIDALLAIDQENEYILFYNSFRNVRRNLPEWTQKNVKIVAWRYPNKIFSPLLQGCFNYPKVSEKLEVDVFFAPNPNFLALSSKVANVVAVHDLSFLRFPEFFSLENNLKHWALRVKKNLPRFDKIIAISENTKLDLVELCAVPEERIEVIYSGVSEEFYQYRSPQDQARLQIVKAKYDLPNDFIFYLGTLEPRKNIPGLIKAFDIFLSNYKGKKDYHLVLAGAWGWRYQEIKRALQSSQHRKKIKILGYVDQDDKPALYNLARLFVFPSFYEGFGFPPLEALYCGTPVISSTSSSLPELIGDQAILVNPYNIREIASALFEALKGDNNIKNNLTKRGFSWNEVAHKYLKELKDAYEH